MIVGLGVRVGVMVNVFVGVRVTDGVGVIAAAVCLN